MSLQITHIVPIMETRSQRPRPVAQRVARNVAELRAERGLSVRQLAARLGEVVGYSLAPSAVSKIENEERRVDADGIHTCLAVIAQPNPASEALHTAVGFRHVGTLRDVGRKFDRWVDTALWQRLRP